MQLHQGKDTMSSLLARTYRYFADATHNLSTYLCISIGMGMNTALRDAQKFNELLDKFEDDLDLALPQFSKDRVKEGNSLSDMAYYLYCFDTKHQLIETVHMIVRGTLATFLPSLVSKQPQMVIGNPKWQLADVYQLASDQGIIQKHRRINDTIRQEYFEMQHGMITRKPSSSNTFLPLSLQQLQLQFTTSMDLCR